MKLETMDTKLRRLGMILSKDIKEKQYIRFTKGIPNATTGRILDGDIFYVNHIVQLKTTEGKPFLHFNLVRVKRDGTPKSMSIAKNVVYVRSFFLDDALKKGTAEVFTDFSELDSKAITLDTLKEILNMIGAEALAGRPVNKLILSRGRRFLIELLLVDDAILPVLKSKIRKALDSSNIQYDESRLLFSINKQQ